MESATITKIHINNLLVDAQGKHVPTTLQLHRYIASENEDGGPKATKWRRSHEDANLEVGLTAGETIGFGRCGVVFAASLDYISDYSNSNAPENSAAHEILLPLVMKFASGKKNSLSSLTDEAYNYQQLTSLQGIAVPRCYGWFRGVLEDDTYIPGVKSRKISVILLERIGEPLTKEESNQDTNDMKDIFTDIAQAGIQHQDIRYSNIFQAPSPIRGLPNSICPTHQRQHKYRLIDFELAKRSMENPQLTADNCLARLRRMYRDFDHFMIAKERIAGKYESFTMRDRMPDRWEDMWADRF